VIGFAKTKSKANPKRKIATKAKDFVVNLTTFSFVSNEVKRDASTLVKLLPNWCANVNTLNGAAYIPV